MSLSPVVVGPVLAVVTVTLFGVVIAQIVQDWKNITSRDE